MALARSTIRLPVVALGGALAAAVAVGFGLGILAGRPRAGEGEAAASAKGGAETGPRGSRLAVVDPAHATARGPLGEAASGARGVHGGGAEHAHTSHDHGSGDDPPPDLDRYPPGSFDRLFAEFIGQMREEAVPAGPLGEALLRDPGLLGEALARLKGERDPEALAALAALLGQVRHPEVEAAAVALAQGADPSLRAAALDILDAFETPAAVPVALSIIAQERDADMVARAIYALPHPAGFGAAEAAPVAGELRRQITSADDPEVRRRAAIAYAAWGGADAEALLVQALADPSPDVRAGAAFGLESRRARSPEAIAALAAVLRDARQPRVVRENAYQALSRVSPLPPSAAAAYRAYEIEREGG